MRKERNLVLTSCIVHSLLCKVIDYVFHVYFFPNTWIFLTEKLTGSWGHSESKGSVEHFAALHHKQAWQSLTYVKYSYIVRENDTYSYMSVVYGQTLWFKQGTSLAKGLFCYCTRCSVMLQQGEKRQRIKIKWYLWWCVCTSSAGCGFISFSVSRTVI